MFGSVWQQSGLRDHMTVWYHGSYDSGRWRSVTRVPVRRLGLSPLVLVHGRFAPVQHSSPISSSLWTHLCIGMSLTIAAAQKIYLFQSAKWITFIKGCAYFDICKCPLRWDNSYKCSWCPAHCLGPVDHYQYAGHFPIGLGLMGWD